MNMLAYAINAAERVPLSDTITLAGIDYLCGRTKRRLAETSEDIEQDFLQTMKNFPRISLNWRWGHSANIPAVSIPIKTPPSNTPKPMR